MKLYVWHGILCDYTCGVAFALASSVEEARALIIASAPEQWRKDRLAKEIAEEPAVYDAPMGDYVEGGG